MFKLAAEPIFTHVVPILVPVDGGLEKQTMKVTYNVLTSERYRELLDEDQFALVRELIARIEDVVDQNGDPMDYNDALRDHLIELPYVRLGLLRGYNDAIVGAQAKN